MEPNSEQQVHLRINRNMNSELNIPNSSAKNSRQSLSGNNSAKNSSRQSTTQKSIDVTSDSLMRENSSHYVNSNFNLDLPPHVKEKLKQDSKSSSEHFDNDEFYFPADHSRIEVNKNESLLSD